MGWFSMPPCPGVGCCPFPPTPASKNMTLFLCNFLLCFLFYFFNYKACNWSIGFLQIVNISKLYHMFKSNHSTFYVQSIQEWFPYTRGEQWGSRVWTPLAPRPIPELDKGCLNTFWLFVVPYTKLSSLKASLTTSILPVYAQVFNLCRLQFLKFFTLHFSSFELLNLFISSSYFF
jgi:hypothetical protein